MPWRIALTVLTLLLAATPARADVPAPWRAKALATAQQRWNPGCGALTLTFGDPAVAGVTRDDPEGAGQLAPDAAGWTAIGSCDIHLNAALPWRSYPVFCAMVMHEAGHSVGLPDTNGRGIMNVGVAVSRDVSYSRRRGHWRRTVHWHGAPRVCIRPLDR